MYLGKICFQMIYMSKKMENRFNFWLIAVVVILARVLTVVSPCNECRVYWQVLYQRQDSVYHCLKERRTNSILLRYARRASFHEYIEKHFEVAITVCGDRFSAKLLLVARESYFLNNHWFIVPTHIETVAKYEVYFSIRVFAVFLKWNLRFSHF